MGVRVKVWLEGDGRPSFGAGKARILQAVERTGSLSRAARELGMSYRHAWSAVRAAEQRLGKPLLVRRRGGRERGGATLTPFAREMVETFLELEARVREYTDTTYDALTRGRRRAKR